MFCLSILEMFCLVYIEMFLFIRDACLSVHVVAIVMFCRDVLLCLGGRSHEAYGSRFVYVCMYLSVRPSVRRSVCLSAGFLVAR